MSTEEKYKCLNNKLTELTKQKLWGKLEEVTGEIQLMENEFPHLAYLDVEEIPDATESRKPVLSHGIPVRPDYFKMATIHAIDEDSKEIRLVVDPTSTPTCQNGDGCAVNLKGARLVEEQLGIPSPLSICNSHI